MLATISWRPDLRGLPTKSAIVRLRPGESMTPTQRTLVKARGYIEKGWCQGASFRRRHGKKVAWCVLGALAETHAPSQIECDAIRLLCDVMCKQTRVLASWNDFPGRTKAQVLRAFDRAIRLAGVEK